jgi:hypothetical protein
MEDAIWTVRNFSRIMVDRALPGWPWPARGVWRAKRLEEAAPWC